MFVSQFIASRKERQTSIHLSKIKRGPQESLAEFVKHFHQEAVLILDMEDGVEYTSFLNSLKNGHFKFSLAEQKETTLAEALRKVTDFIRAIEISAESTGTSKKAKVPADRNVGRGDRRSRLNVRDSHFTVDPRSILVEVKGHRKLRKAQPLTLALKPYNAWKYCEFH